MLVYRLTLKAFSNTLLAPGFAGRWNGEGRKVIYAAESIALAFLESMIRRQGVGFNDDFKIMVIKIPDSLPVTTINADDLKEGWRNFREYAQCQDLGNRWFDAIQTPVLKVPLAVLPQACNFVLHTLHADFKKIKIVDVVNLVPDERIENILRKNNK